MALWRPRAASITCVTVARENPTVFCALLAKVLPLTIADEKATEVPQVTEINFIGMEPVPFGDGQPTRLDKAPVKRTCE